MSYNCESHNLMGAVAACMLAERQGDDPSLCYVPDIHPLFPAGLDWKGIARALWDAGDALSVDTLSSAPYRVMIGTDIIADNVGWVDVDEDADVIGNLPDSPMMDWIG